jgi:hypothetical protein
VPRCCDQALPSLRFHRAFPPVDIEKSTVGKPARHPGREYHHINQQSAGPRHPSVDVPLVLRPGTLRTDDGELAVAHTLPRADADVRLNLAGRVGTRIAISAEREPIYLQARMCARRSDEISICYEIITNCKAATACDAGENLRRRERFQWLRNIAYFSGSIV